jgi:hypothetical protein
MKELSFAQVRAAERPAWVDMPHVTYEYSPMLDDVSVRIRADRQPAGTTYRMPKSGWRHEEGCLCIFCRMAEEETAS